VVARALAGIVAGMGLPVSDSEALVWPGPRPGAHQRVFRRRLYRPSPLGSAEDSLAPFGLGARLASARRRSVVLVVRQRRRSNQSQRLRERELFLELVRHRSGRGVWRLVAGGFSTEAE